MSKQLELDVFSKAEENMRVKERELYGPPAGWKWIEIEEMVAEFQSGFACSKKYATERGIPHLRPNNIGFYGKLDFSQLVFLPPDLVNLEKYSLKKGDVLFNNTNSKELVGRASLVKEDLDYGFSNHITRLRVNKQLVLPEWLVLSINHLWLAGHFLSICRKWVGQAGVNTAMLKSIKIPLPPFEEQERIIAILEEPLNKTGAARELRRTSREQTEEIMQAALHEVFSEAKEEWGLTKLVKICRINPSKSEMRALPDDTQVTFVPMAAVSEITRRIEKPEVRLLGEVRKGYTYFSENDVLFAKITPCMENGKSVIARHLVNGLGFGSTEFHVLRPFENVALPEWILHYVRQKSFRDYAAKHMTGSVGQQRVPVHFVRSVKMPLPPIEEQRKLVAYLDNVSRIVGSLRNLQQKTEEELEKLVPAILDEAFKGEL